MQTICAFAIHPATYKAFVSIEAVLYKLAFHILLVCGLDVVDITIAACKIKMILSFLRHPSTFLDLGGGAGPHNLATVGPNVIATGLICQASEKDFGALGPRPWKDFWALGFRPWKDF